MHVGLFLLYVDLTGVLFVVITCVSQKLWFCVHELPHRMFAGAEAFHFRLQPTCHPVRTPPPPTHTHTAHPFSAQSDTFMPRDLKLHSVCFSISRGTIKVLTNQESPTLMCERAAAISHVVYVRYRWQLAYKKRIRKGRAVPALAATVLSSSMAVPNFEHKSEFLAW